MDYCATVAGTFCDLVKALHVTRHSGCQDCPFFKSMHFDLAAKTTILKKMQNKGAPKFTEAPL